MSHIPFHPSAAARARLSAGISRLGMRRSRPVVGLTLGVFDFCHEGHVSLLRRAAGLCDRLVVGVHTDDELMLMTSGGQSIRIRVSEIREAGRNTQGVRLVSLREGESLQGVARVIADGDEDAANGPPAPAGPPAD